MQIRKKTGILDGRVMPTLLSFAFPIICGNIFQQLYNIVDAMVVGAYLGDLPLGGISAAAPIMDVLYGIITGGTVGVSALLAQLFGAGKHSRMKRVHVTALYFGTAFTLLRGIISLIAAPLILRAQHTAESVLSQSMQYLTIICLGLVLNFVYSYYAASLRACGNSAIPFWVLLSSSILHAGLDVLLVGVFQLGIIGVAFSTVFCQGLSGVFLFLYCQKRFSELAVAREDRPDRKEIGPVAGFAWAGALQQIVVQVGRLLVQGMVSNLPTDGVPAAEQAAFRSNSVTGYNMGMRVENFLFSIIQGVSGASVVVISQNFGHGNGKRATRFYQNGLLIALCYGIVLFAVCRTFPRWLIGLFSSNEQVLAAGTRYISLMAFFYLFACFGEIIQSLYRGIGKLRVCALSSGLQVLLRVILSALLIPRMGIPGISYAVAAGWILMVLIEGGFSLRRCRLLAAMGDAADAPPEN